MNRDYRHIRHLLLFFFDQKTNAENAHQIITKTYSKCISEERCYEWYAKFENDDFNLQILNSGCGEFTNKELQDRLNKNPNLTNTELSEIFNIHESVISQRRKRLNEAQNQRNQDDLASQPVLQLVDLVSQIRFNICASLRTRFEKQEHFLDHVVTRSEKVLRRNISNETDASTSNDFKLYMWWDQEGVIDYKVLLPHEVDSASFSQHINNLKEALDSKRPQEAGKRRKVILLCESFAQLDILKSVKDQIMEFEWEILPCPASYPDMVPSDDTFFARLFQIPF